jgi:hypothetical protein
MKKIRSILKKKMTWEEIMNFYLSPKEEKILDFLAIVDYGRVEEMSLATGLSRSTLEKKSIPKLRKLGLVYKYTSKKIEQKDRKKIQLYYISKLGCDRLWIRPYDISSEYFPSETDDNNRMFPPTREMNPQFEFKHRLLLGEVAAYLIWTKGLSAGLDVRNARKFRSEAKKCALKVVPDLYLYGISGPFSGRYLNKNPKIEFWEIETNENNTKRLEQKLRSYVKSEKDLMKCFGKEEMTLVFAMRIEKKEMWMNKFNKAMENLYYKEFSAPTFHIQFLFLTEDFVNSYEEGYVKPF